MSLHVWFGNRLRTIQDNFQPSKYVVHHPLSFIFAVSHCHVMHCLKAKMTFKNIKNDNQFLFTTFHQYLEPTGNPKCQYVYTLWVCNHTIFRYSFSGFPLNKDWYFLVFAMAFWRIKHASCNRRLDDLLSWGPVRICGPRSATQGAKLSAGWVGAVSRISLRNTRKTYQINPWTPWTQKASQLSTQYHT